MAWMIAMNIKKKTIGFVSFTDVYDPRVAEDWKYLNNKMMLINASSFYLA